MRSLKYAHDVIEILKLSGVSSIYQSGNCFTIPKTDNTTLVSISDSNIDINGANFNDRITPAKVSKLNTGVEITTFETFMKELSTVSEIRLNHCGISYYCNDLESEIDYIQKLVGNDELYEEDSGVSSTKWLFIGNTNKYNEPLFELVLNKRQKPTLSSWAPHFQIDIDTTLSIEDLKYVVQKHLGDDWIKWSIDVEGLGTPLVMGRLCSFDGLKVYLGIGTNKRSREWHRKNGLRRL
ncbi:hypothetical protein KBD20_04880 [Candidatus Saccharibacteria bacterium]|nr:hypothetical protein [Candidatus Saccharibacteria bacterium]